MKINHNTAAMMANTQLLKAGNNVSASLKRLSSGYKITKSADDPAGKAISQKMRTQIKGLERASQNAADGNSVLQTAEGSLSEVSAMVRRMRELAVQAANDTYILEDRKTIQNEIDQILDEIDRISNTTEFNKKYLLNGSLGRTAISTSDATSVTNVSQAVPKGSYDVLVNSVGTPATNTVNYAPAAQEYTIFINGAEVVISPTDTMAEAKAKVTEVCNEINMTLQPDGTTIKTNVAGMNQQIAIEYSYNPGNVTTTRGTDAVVDISAFEATASYTAVGNMVSIVDKAGFSMSFELKDTFASGDTFKINVYDAGSLTMQIGANEGQVLDINIPEISCRTIGMRTSSGENILNVCTGYGAQLAMDLCDGAISVLSSARAQIGAYQNRLESSIASLDISVENMTDALSRILDTDMAAEMTKYTQYSVISQAATSMLAQANNRPQQIMALLQG